MDDDEPHGACEDYVENQFRALDVKTRIRSGLEKLRDVLGRKVKATA